MALPAYTHVVISGALGTSEVWACGFDLDGFVFDQDGLDTIVENVRLTLVTGQDGYTGIRKVMGSTTSVQAITAYYYEAGATSASLISTATQVVLGGAGNSNPYNTCAVVTLRTAVPSRRTRGRMYLPNTGGSLLTTGLADSNSTDGAVLAVQAFLTANGPDHNPVVISRAGSMATAIVAVSADNKPDVQRRRSNKLEPTYSKVTTL